MAAVAPLNAMRISRDDIRRTLHTHFHGASASASASSSSSMASTSGGGTSAASGGRHRIFSFLQVCKNRSMQPTKRLFNSSGSAAAHASHEKSNMAAQKSYLLCVTVQDGDIGTMSGGGGGRGGGRPRDRGAVAQLHYVQFRSTFAVDVRATWALHRLGAVEQHERASPHSRGAFLLHWSRDPADADAADPWVVAATEPAHAMAEFIWSLTSLVASQRGHPQELVISVTSSPAVSSSPPPRLIRFSAEELDELAEQKQWRTRYRIRGTLSNLLQLAGEGGAGTDRNTAEANPADPGRENTDKSNAVDASGDERLGSGCAPAQRLTAAESADAVALLQDVDWHESPLMAVEADLTARLRELEDENIAFLLSLERERVPSGRRASGPAGVTTAASMDHILRAIETLQTRVERTDDWTRDAGAALEQVSLSMLHFESLNNQLEVHFKNSVALHEALSAALEAVDVPREQMAILLGPVTLWEMKDSDDDDSDGATTASKEPLQYVVSRALAATLKMLERVDSAISATRMFPACEMAALRARGEELNRLVCAHVERISAALQVFLLQVCKPSSGGSAKSSSHSTNTSNHRSSNSSVAGPASSSTLVTIQSSTTITGGTAYPRSVATQRVDWMFTNSRVHDALLPFAPLFAQLAHLDNEDIDRGHGEYKTNSRALLGLRTVYAKTVASNLYTPHINSLFRSLRDCLPRRPAKSLFPASVGSGIGNTGAVPSNWGLQLSSSVLTSTATATASTVDNGLSAPELLEQALDHIVPLVLQEQRFLAVVFFPELKAPTSSRMPFSRPPGIIDGPVVDSDALTALMEVVFEKTLKRLGEFGEAAATRNILDALAMASMVATRLDASDRQVDEDDPGDAKGSASLGAFLYDVLVGFQLQLKRVLIKFTDELATWIHGHNHTDTHSAGVLTPIRRTLSVVARLESSVQGRSDDTTLATMYHRLLPTTLQWLDRIAEAKPKYASLTRYENYYFMSEQLRAINATDDLPLAQYAAQAQTRCIEARTRYVEYVWSYEFKQLVPAFARLDELLLTLPPSELSFHMPRQEMRRLLDAFTATFEKSAKNLFDRVKKHFRVNAAMLPVIWVHIIAYGSEQVTHYANIAATCYQLRVEPGSLRVTEMLQRLQPSTPGSPAISTVS